MIWFSADFHFNHANIIRLCNRPFSNVDDMNDTLLANINDRIAAQDTLYFLGDWSFNNISHYRSQINCKNIHFIIGNHDHFQSEDRKCFGWIKQMYDLKVGKFTIVLCHYPLREWNKSFHGSYHLFGHCHGNLPPYKKSFDIGVDPCNYVPLNIDQVFDKFKEL